MQRQRPIGASTARAAAPLLGLAFGITVVIKTPGRHDPLWIVWAFTALTLSTAAGGIFAYGLGRWAELVSLHPLPVRRVVAPVAAVVGIGLAIVNSPSLISRSYSGWRLDAFLMLAIVASVPVGGVMYGVRYVVSIQPTPGTRGAQVMLLIALRRLLQRLLATLGAEVALVTVHAAALFAFESSAHPSGSHAPQHLLVVGGVGSLLVALAYVPGWSALQRRERRLCDELFPIERIDDAPAILTSASDRQRLEQILGADQNLLADIQTALAILGPLLAGVAGAFLPH